MHVEPIVVEGQSDSNVYEAQNVEINTPLKCNVKIQDKNVQGKVFENIEPQNVCDMITKMSEKKKYKKIGINVEFIESD